MSGAADAVVVGAGPAGMSAAAALAEAGAHTVVLDEQAGPGGQIYRGVETVRRLRPADMAFLGSAYARGAGVVEAFRAVRLDYRPGAAVWHVGAPGRGGRRDVLYSRGGAASRVSARYVVIATGALERPVPVPGWTLPGAMTAGAVQSALKTSGVYPAGRPVLAGSGPLLLQLAAQLLAARVPVAAIVDTTPPGGWRRAFLRLPGALAAGPYLARGWEMLRAVRRSGVPVHAGASRLALRGEDRVTAVAFHAGGGERTVEADVVALHEGVVPDTHLSRLAGVEHRWDAPGRCFRPVVGPWGETSAPGVYIAGDGGGIAGAVAAGHGGRIAGLAVAERLGLVGEAERDFRAEDARTRRFLELGLRPFLDRWFPPPDAAGAIPDGVAVCRCEETTAGEVRAAVAEGCAGPNQVKAFLRCGMGPCQGRMCAATVTEIVAAARGRSPAEVGTFRVRPPARAVTLAEIAEMAAPGGG